jgi:hypothetical protein
MGSIANGWNWVSQVARNTTEQVTEQIKNVDLDSVKSTVEKTTSVGWSMAADYLTKAKDVVGEKYSTFVTQTPSLSTIVGNNLQPSKMPGVGSNNYGYNQNQGPPLGNPQRTTSDTRWDDWDEPENQRSRNPVGSSGNWNRDSGYDQESSNSGYERDISGNSSASNSGSREIRNPYRSNYGDDNDNMSSSQPVYNRRNMPNNYPSSSSQANPNVKSYPNRERSPSPNSNPPTQKNNYYDNPNNDNNSFSNSSKSGGFPNTSQNQYIPSSTLSRSQNISKSNPPDNNKPTQQNRKNSTNDGWDEWDDSFSGNKGKDNRAPTTTKNNTKPVSSAWNDDNDSFTSGNNQVNTKAAPITSKNTSKPVTSGWDDDNDFADF